MSMNQPRPQPQGRSRFRADISTAITFSDPPEGMHPDHHKSLRAHGYRYRGYDHISGVHTYSKGSHRAEYSEDDHSTRTSKGFGEPWKYHKTAAGLHSHLKEVHG